jgi:branched-subunit amino acid aminotransferase/4-amino-4-deoxychorismate lyase
MHDPPVPRIEINGRPVGVDAHHILALGNYGDFTVMQVRSRRTRGLDLHLKRLDVATRQLFGRSLDGDRVCDLIRHALGDDVDDGSVRVSVVRADGDDDVSIVLTVKPPAEMASTAQRLQAVGYQRSVAHIKHSGDFGQDYYRRLAQRNGFDEALLTAPDGALSEGAITNIGFLAGSAVVWPDAPALEGITMQLLRRGLAERGVPWRRRTVHLANLASFDAAFVSDSRGVAPVERVDDLTLPISAWLMRTLANVYESAPWDPV